MVVISRDEIRKTLLELFELETGEKLESLKDEQNLAEEFGLDSVDMVSLIMQLESRFKIRMSHEDLVNASEVGNLLDVVERKLNAPKDSSADHGEQKIAA